MPDYSGYDVYTLIALLEAELGIYCELLNNQTFKEKKLEECREKMLEITIAIREAINAKSLVPARPTRTQSKTQWP